MKKATGRIILFSLILSSSLCANENLGSITVTANKVEEKLLNVPQSITVIDDEILKQKNIKSISGVIAEIPNMNMIPDHGKRVNFRGLNSSLFTNSNPVVIYIDGVPTSNSREFEASMSNVKRIEVLRGPQGTLYGKDAIGGVINIVTKEPTNELSAELGLEYGSYNYMGVDFNVRKSIIDDKLFMGLSGDYSQDDGWITNDYKNDDEATKEKKRNLSAFLEFKPTDELKLKLIVNNQYEKKFFDNGYGLAPKTKIGEFKREKAKHVNFDVSAYQKSKINSQSLLVHYMFDKIDFDSITTHKKLDLDSNFDSDFGMRPEFKGLSQFDHSKVKNITQEFRFSYDTDSIRWIAGFYADKEEHKQAPYGMEFPNFNPKTYQFLGNFYMDAHSESNSDTYATFAQAMIPLGDFELTLGGRYQKIKKDIDLNTYFLPIGQKGKPMFSLNAKRDWNKFLPKAALSYKINSNINTYFLFSQGYMPGGFNYFATSGDAQDNSFEPQQSKNYELGIKTNYNNFSFGASIFRMDIKDIHVYKSAAQGIYLTDNAKKAHSQGLEFEFNYYPTNNLELNSGVGFINAKYDDYDAGDKKYDGQKIEQTPSHTINLGLLYTNPNGFYGRVDVKHSGGMYFFDDSRKEFQKVDSKTTGDIKLGYKLKKWDIYTYVTNVTDEKYINTFKSSSIVSIATFGEPRKFGFGTRYKF